MKTHVKTIFLNKTDQKRARKFAKDRYDQNNDLYDRRGGFKIEDVISGAMAELGVYRMLKEKGVPVGYPDFKIYEANRKSYDADLTDGLHHFHVKGQTLASKERYGASWIMQRKDPIINNPEKLHYIVPCTVDINTGRVEIYGIFSIKSLINQACFSECKVEWFRRTKIALYLDHIQPIFTKRATWGFFEKFKDRLEA